jgi:hypothetical protein
VPAVEGAEAEPQDAVSPEGICPCCGLEVPAVFLADLVTRPLPVVSTRSHEPEMPAG